MAKLEDVFSREWNRENPAEWNKIHLYKMGDFWRAYEWSAWLISVVSFNDKVRMTTKDRKPLHVTRMHKTDVEDATYCFVGFPVKSVEKYIPERDKARPKVKVEMAGWNKTTSPTKRKGSA